uniref:Uncharacterized protein n=1 Tax=Amphimedon queenslandica TaxID=400682 RepID=A0A1X7UV73_AMPQE
MNVLYIGKDFYNALEYRCSSRQKRHAENIEDIYDGVVYEQFFQGILSNRNNTSLKHNTDGLLRVVFGVFVWTNDSCTLHVRAISISGVYHITAKSGVRIW